MASIERRPSGTWRARWREVPSGPQKTRHFERKIDAERFLDTVRGDLARGLYVDPSSGRQRFGDYARHWQSAQIHRPTTAAQVASHLERHILPWFADKQLAAVRPSDVQAWVKGRSQVLAPATVEVVYRYLAAIFKAATEDRLIGTSPCRAIKLPKLLPAPVIPLETDQVLALAEALPERYAPIVITAAGTGLRQGELFGLEVKHIDFLRRTLRVDQQMITLSGRPPFIAPPKTPSSHRSVPLPEIVVRTLAAHLAAHPTDGLVFVNTQGRPIRRNTFGEAWHRAARAAGIPDWATFHDLRHFYASLLIRHGESVKVVQARLGHASAAETLNTYAHLWPDSEDRTRRAVDHVLGADPTAIENDRRIDRG